MSHGSTPTSRVSRLPPLEGSSGDVVLQEPAASAVRSAGGALGRAALKAGSGVSAWRTSVEKAAIWASLGEPPLLAISFSTSPLPPAFLAAASSASASAGKASGAIGKAAVHHRRQPLGWRQPKPYGGAKIGDGARRLAEALIGHAAQIERLGGLRRRKLVGADRRRHLPRRELVFAGGEGGSPGAQAPRRPLAPAAEGARLEAASRTPRMSVGQRKRAPMRGVRGSGRFR